MTTNSPGGQGAAGYAAQLAELRAVTTRARAIAERVDREGFGPLGATTAGALVMYAKALETRARDVVEHDEFLHDSRAPRTIDAAWTPAARCKALADAHAAERP